MSWVERVEEELVRRKLPRREVARLMEELRDHVADLAEVGSSGGGMVSLQEKNMSMDASVIEALGSPEEIAEAAVRELRQRKNLLARSRLAAFCTFVLLPLPFLCALWAGVLALVVLLGTALGVENRDGGYPGPLEVLIMHGFLLAIWLVPGLGTAGLFGRLARRTGRSWRWGLSASLVVALAMSGTRYTLTLSEVPEQSQAMLGIGWHPQVLPFLLPLAVGFLVLFRDARRSALAAA